MALADAPLHDEPQRLRALLRETLSQLSEGVSIFDADCRLVAVSARAITLSGLTAEQAVPGVHLRDLLLLQAQAGEFGPCEPHAEVDRRMARLQASVLETYERERPDGRVIEVRRSPMADGGFLTVYLDVTERRAQERRIRESERFVATIADNLPGMMGYWTCDLRCAFANRTYQTWFERTPEQMNGIALEELLGKDLFAMNEPYIRAVLRGENQQFERMLVNPRGEVRYTWAQYIADIWENEVRGFFVLVSDITTLKQSQLDLDAVNAAMRISAIAFEGQEGIVVTDAQRTVLKVNSAFTRITGFAAGDLVGQSALRFAASRHDPSHVAAIRDRAQRTGSWVGELWCTHADGHDFPVSITVTAVPDAAGAIANYVITYIDITERQHRDEQRRADEAVQRAALVREVHHRIKNNLQGITGLLQLFGRANPQTQEALNQAISQVKSIATIHGLQGQSGTSTIVLCDLVHAIAEQVREVWQVPLNTSLASDCSGFSIAGEETVPVALILNELLLNAVKHRQPASSAVAITVCRVGAGAQVRINNLGTLKSQSPQGMLTGAGQQLVTGLMPSSGAHLMIRQIDGQVVTQLDLETPVLTMNNNQ